MGSGGTNEGAFIEKGGPRRKEIPLPEGDGPKGGAVVGRTKRSGVRDARPGLPFEGRSSGSSTAPGSALVGRALAVLRGAGILNALNRQSVTPWRPSIMDKSRT